MTSQAIRSIARYAPRTKAACWLPRPAIARARNVATAPSNPTENVTCAVSATLRTRGDMIMIGHPCSNRRPANENATFDNGTLRRTGPDGPAVVRVDVRADVRHGRHL